MSPLFHLHPDCSLLSDCLFSPACAGNHHWTRPGCASVCLAAPQSRRVQHRQRIRARSQASPAAFTDSLPQAGEYDAIEYGGLPATNVSRPRIPVWNGSASSRSAQCAEAEYRALCGLCAQASHDRHDWVIVAAQAERSAPTATNLPREHQNERTNILLADRRVLSCRILGRCTTAGPCGINCHVPCSCSRRTAV
jgi:hypothetical protein